VGSMEEIVRTLLGPPEKLPDPASAQAINNVFEFLRYHLDGSDDRYTKWLDHVSCRVAVAATNSPAQKARQHAMDMAVPCPKCDARPGEGCFNVRKDGNVHLARRNLWDHSEK
jgi:hypothetical protein